MKNNDIIHEGRTASMDADALGDVTSGWDTSTPDQILENLETWKNRVQNEKGFLRDSAPPLTVSQNPAPKGQRTRKMRKIETIHKEIKRATCRNSLRRDYSAKDAIEDLELAIKAAEASRNREEPRMGKTSWHISRKW
jgi:hypothetical protein